MSQLGGVGSEGGVSATSVGAVGGPGGGSAASGAGGPSETLPAEVRSRPGSHGLAPDAVRARLFAELAAREEGGSGAIAGRAEDAGLRQPVTAETLETLMAVDAMTPKTTLDRMAASALHRLHNVEGDPAEKQQLAFRLGMLVGPKTLERIEEKANATGGYKADFDFNPGQAMQWAKAGAAFASRPNEDRSEGVGLDTAGSARIGVLRKHCESAGMAVGEREAAELLKALGPQVQQATKARAIALQLQSKGNPPVADIGKALRGMYNPELENVLFQLETRGHMTTMCRAFANMPEEKAALHAVLEKRAPKYAHLFD